MRALTDLSRALSAVIRSRTYADSLESSISEGFLIHLRTCFTDGVKEDHSPGVMMLLMSYTLFTSSCSVSNAGSSSLRDSIAARSRDPAPMSLPVSTPADATACFAPVLSIVSNATPPATWSTSTTFAARDRRSRCRTLLPNVSTRSPMRVFSSIVELSSRRRRLATDLTDCCSPYTCSASHTCSLALLESKNATSFLESTLRLDSAPKFLPS
mmetsp:Transcript_11251/g.35907  ORF Transcript_11251/g.35907 Transcript_11251/m.35907 type:complete len:213 (+) Transcript_11251:899-1537(+)